MSYDLWVWHAPAYSARAMKTAIASDDVAQQVAFDTSPELEAFAAQILSIFPPLEALSDLAETPWSVSPDSSDRLIGLALQYPAVEFAAPIIVRTAFDHGLFVFDPQDESIYPPASADASKVRDVIRTSGRRRWAPSSPAPTTGSAALMEMLIRKMGGVLMPKVRYGEGDWFAVPLRDEGFGTCLVARRNPRGVLLGYFFGPRKAGIPAVPEVEGLAPRDAALIGMFGDLGIINGTWPSIGRIEGWDRTGWPMPSFIRYEELSGRTFRVIYDDDDPHVLVREEQVKPGESTDGPEDGLMGAGFVELQLTWLLQSRSERIDRG